MRLRKGFDYLGVTVVFLCHDGKGNIVLSKRGKNCRDEHGRWDPGAGSLELGQTIEQTLKREIKEEYCAVVLDEKFLGFRELHRIHKNKKTHWIALDFLVLVDKNQVKNGEPHKFDAVEWFKLNRLPSPLHSQFPKFLKKYSKQIELLK